MEKALFLAIGITIVFGIFKFLEMKYLDKHLKPLRDLVRDLVMVFLSSFYVPSVYYTIKQKSMIFSLF